MKILLLLLILSGCVSKNTNNADDKVYDYKQLDQLNGTYKYNLRGE